MKASKATARKRSAERKPCCGPPVPTTAPGDGMCLNPLECADAMKVLSDPNRIKIIRKFMGTGNLYWRR